MSEIYTVVFDNGKPYEKEFIGYKELEEGLRAFYFLHRDSDAFYDAHVYNSDKEDITDSQFIAELIGEIIEVD